MLQSTRNCRVRQELLFESQDFLYMEAGNCALAWGEPGVSRQPIMVAAADRQMAELWLCFLLIPTVGITALTEDP